MRHVRFLMVLCGAAAALALPAAASAQEKSSVIDFDSVNAPQSPTGEGLVLSQVSSGNGISGDALSGHAGVLGTNPELAGNTAVVYDSTCTVDGNDGQPEDCSGEDEDLLKPVLRNTLIVAEDLVDANANGRIDDPDDADAPGMVLDFDLSTLEGGSFDVDSIDVLDVDDDEAGGHVDALRNGAVVKSAPIAVLGDNSLQTVNLNAEDVDAIRVVLAGSAAIDNIRLRSGEEPPPPPPGGEGCTPGYWKNHLDSWAAAGFSPSQALSTVFSAAGLGTLAGNSLLEALNYDGGSSIVEKKRILLRAAVASVLNSAHPGVSFDMTTSDIVSAVNAALATNNKDTILALADRLDRLNNSGCGLN
jgi:hypothetical protein